VQLPRSRPWRARISPRGGQGARARGACGRADPVLAEEGSGDVGHHGRYHHREYRVHVAGALQQQGSITSQKFDAPRGLLKSFKFGRKNEEGKTLKFLKVLRVGPCCGACNAWPALARRDAGAARAGTPHLDHDYNERNRRALHPS
jgi:hypothetical protein